MDGLPLSDSSARERRRSVWEVRGKGEGEGMVVLWVWEEEVKN